MKFELGQVVMTHAVSDTVEKSKLFNIIARYQNNDWGDLDLADKKLNDIAVKNNNDRILAKYNIGEDEPIYVITEWDRSYTTILFTSEY